MINTTEAIHKEFVAKYTAVIIAGIEAERDRLDMAYNSRAQMVLSRYE